MSRYASHISTLATPQSSPIPNKPMVANNAGGFAFALDDWKRLDRFLILGSEAGSYYVGERELTIDNAKCVSRCIAADGVRTVARIVEISDAGRAPKNDPAIFALAMCVAQASGTARTAALDAIPKVCRIGTHLFQFIGAIKQLTKWNRSLRRAVGNWYTLRDPKNLAMQVIKYQNRNGYTHRDVLRLSHPRMNNAVRPIIAYAAGKPLPDVLPPLIVAHEQAKTADESTIVRLIREHGLPRECVPTAHLNSQKIWEALLEDMPLTAMIRNLATMTRCGLIAPMSDGTSKVIAALNDADKLHKARIHPVAILIAMLTYSAGRGLRGQNTWTPVSQMVDALDAAFYKAFKNVEPTGKRHLLALDVSGSMSSGDVAGIPGMTARIGSSAMALVTAATEPSHHFVAFTSGGWHCGAAGKGQWAASHNIHNGITPLTISPRQRLNDVCTQVEALQMGGTDCALPMLYAMENKIPVDLFCVYTDNETWAGDIHPMQALAQYRKAMGIDAKLVVIGMTSTGFTIADPNDPGMLDVAGFDSAVPSLIAEFARG